MKTGFLPTIFAVLVAFYTTGCGGGEPEKKPNRVEHLSGKTLTETIQENRQRLLSIPGVIRVEAGDCSIDSCIKVYVQKKTEMVMTQLPAMLETWRVEIVETVDQPG